MEEKFDISENTVKRFWEKVSRVDDNDSCWEWIGGRNAAGYGLCTIGLRGVPAHRISWMILHNQIIPKGFVICHRCDNPPCVRPTHLFLGSKKDNSADMASKGRAANQKINAKEALEANKTEIREYLKSLSPVVKPRLDAWHTYQITGKHRGEPYLVSQEWHANEVARYRKELLERNALLQALSTR